MAFKAAFSADDILNLCIYRDQDGKLWAGAVPGWRLQFGDKRQRRRWRRIMKRYAARVERRLSEDSI